MEHSLSFKIKSKCYVKSIRISDESHDLLLFDVNLGELIESSHIEGYVLEIRRSNRVLRMGLTLNQLIEIIKKAALVLSGRRGGAHNKYQENRRKRNEV